MKVSSKLVKYRLQTLKTKFKFLESLDRPRYRLKNVPPQDPRGHVSVRAYKTGVSIRDTARFPWPTTICEWHGLLNSRLFTFFRCDHDTTVMIWIVLINYLLSSIADHGSVCYVVINYNNLQLLTGTFQAVKKLIHTITWVVTCVFLTEPLLHGMFILGQFGTLRNYSVW